MKTLSEILAQITGPDEAARAACLAQWDGLAKPLGSLGLLEDSLARIAAVTGSPDITLDHRTLLVLCADNGVVAQGVTQCGSSVTASVARALAAGESTVCHMARCARSRGHGDGGLLPHTRRVGPPGAKRHGGHHPGPRHDPDGMRPRH